MIADPGEPILEILSHSTAERNGRPVERQDLLRVSRKAPITYALGTDSAGDATIDLYGGVRIRNDSLDYFIVLVLDRKLDFRHTSCGPPTCAASTRNYKSTPSPRQ